MKCNAKSDKRLTFVVRIINNSSILTVVTVFRNIQRCADLRAHVIDEAERQVLLDALHAVAVLPPGGAEVLLQGTGHGGKYGQSCFSHVHNVRGRRALILLFHPPNMSEGLFYSHHQPGKQGAYCQLSILLCLIHTVQ